MRSNHSGSGLHGSAFTGSGFNASRFTEAAPPDSSSTGSIHATTDPMCAQRTSGALGREALVAGKRVMLALAMVGVYVFAVTHLEPGKTRASDGQSMQGAGGASMSASGMGDSMPRSLGTLHNFSNIVRLESSTGGVRYTLLDAEGNLIAEHLTQDELAEMAPDADVRNLQADVPMTERPGSALPAAGAWNVPGSGGK